MGAVWLTGSALPPSPDWLTAPGDEPTEEVERAPSRYDHIDFQPTEAMARAARRGLEYRREHGRGGTAVGVARARDIKNRRNLSPDTVRRMKAYFDRHQSDREAEGSDSSGYWGDRNNPSAGYIAWLLWGGDPGRAWASRRVRQMNAADDEGKTAPADFLTTKASGVANRAQQWRRWVRTIHTPAERRLARAWARYLSGAAERMAKRVEDVPKLQGVAREWSGSDLEIVLAPLEEQAIARSTVSASWAAALRAGFANIAAQITAAALTWDPSISPSDRLIGQMITQVEQYTKARVNDLLSDALRNGATVDEMQSRLITDFAFSPTRALRIARTESTRAVNRGQDIAFGMAADEGVRLRKEWLSSRDAAVRDSHAALDGQQVRPGELFTIPIGFDNAGAQANFPGDFDAPEESINCRCASAPVLLE